MFCVSYLLTRFLTASLYSFIVLCSLCQVLRIVLIERKKYFGEAEQVTNYCLKCWQQELTLFGLFLSLGIIGSNFCSLFCQVPLQILKSSQVRFPDAKRCSFVLTIGFVANFRQVDQSFTVDEQTCIELKVGW